MALASVTLAYQGKHYSFSGDDQSVKGRLSCDCEKSRLIRESCDGDFPLLKCGTEIVVVSVVDVGTQTKRPPGHKDSRGKAKAAG